MREPRFDVQLPEFLTDAGGEIVLSGHRIGLYHVVQRYNEGDSAEMLACITRRYRYR
jgi:hypothetical protein